jgi:hypothetical protein
MRSSDLPYVAQPTARCPTPLATCWRFSTPAMVTLPRRIRCCGGERLIGEARAADGRIVEATTYDAPAELGENVGSSSSMLIFQRVYPLARAYTTPCGRFWRMTLPVSLLRVSGSRNHPEMPSPVACWRQSRLGCVREIGEDAYFQASSPS